MSTNKIAHFAWLSLVLLSACSKPLPELDNFDSARWKDDRNGCNGTRKPAIESLTSQKDKLLALKEMQIVQLLGRPDGNELYERNQKFYYYYFTPAPVCSQPDSAQTRLEIRFNAMGVAKEVYVK